MKSAQNRGMSLLYVFAIIIFFSIIALIINSMIQQYKAHLKVKEIQSRQNEIAMMLQNTLINSVAALSYTVSKCDSASITTDYRQNPLFCLCFDPKSGRRCLASPTDPNTPPDGFPFLLYRSEPQGTVIAPVAGGMVSYCALPDFSNTSCTIKATLSQYLDSKTCSETLHADACVSSSTEILTSYATPAKWDDAKIFLRSPTETTSVGNVRKVFNSKLGIGGSNGSMILLPQNMARYTSKGERCRLEQYVSAQKLTESCPFTVDLRFKVNCGGSASCVYDPGKISLCYSVHYDQSAGGPAIATHTNPTGDATGCTSLKKIIEEYSQGKPWSPFNPNASTSAESSGGSSALDIPGNRSSSGSFGPGTRSSLSAHPTSESSSESSSAFYSSHSSGSAGSSASSSIHPDGPVPGACTKLNQDTGLPSYHVVLVFADVSKQDGSILYAVTSSNGRNDGSVVKKLSKSIDSGATWSTLPASPALADTVYSGYANGTNIYFATEWGFYKSTDQGAHFSHSTGYSLEVPVSSMAVDGADGAKILINANLANANDHHAMYSTDGGQHFNTISEFVSSKKVMISAGRLLSFDGSSISCKATETTAALTTQQIPNIKDFFIYKESVYYMLQDAGGTKSWEAHTLGSDCSISGKTWSDTSQDYMSADWSSLNSVSVSGSRVYTKCPYDSLDYSSNPKITNTWTSSNTFNGAAANQPPTSLFVLDAGVTPIVFAGFSKTGPGADSAAYPGIYVSRDGGSNFNKAINETTMFPSDFDAIYVNGQSLFVGSKSKLGSGQPIFPQYFYSVDGGAHFPQADTRIATQLISNGFTSLSSIYQAVIGSGANIYHALVGCSNGECDSGLFASSNSGASFQRRLFNNPVVSIYRSGETYYLYSSNPVLKNSGFYTSTDMVHFSGFQNTNGINLTWCRTPRSLYVANSSFYLGGDTGGDQDCCQGIWKSNGIDQNFSCVRLAPSIVVNEISGSGDCVYVATDQGLFVASNSDRNFVKKISAAIDAVYAQGKTVYASSGTTVFISANYGESFPIRLSNTNGVPGSVRKIYVDGDFVYIATSSGLARCQ